MTKDTVFSLTGRLFKAVMIIMTFVLFCVVTLNVFTRYVLNNSMGWADELARFLFIWVCFMGATLSFYHDEHVGLNFVVNRIPWKFLKTAVDLADAALVMVVLVVLVWYGWIVAVSATNVSPALYIPMRYIYMIVPFCGAIMAVMNLGKMIGFIRNRHVSPGKGDRI